MVALTPRQKEILTFVTTFIEERGYSPTLAEIGEHLGLTSVATVHKHVANLIDKGVLRRDPRRSRTIEPCEREPGKGRYREIPLLGVIAAGVPIEAVVDRDTIEVPAALLGRGRRCYALRVQGMSMIGEHIRDGDIVIVEDRNVARDGETVVALIEGDQATLKKLYRRGRKVHLVAANPAVRTLILPADQVRVQGVVVGLMRSYR